MQRYQPNVYGQTFGIPRRESQSKRYNPKGDMPHGMLHMQIRFQM